MVLTSIKTKARKYYLRAFVFNNVLTIAVRRV